MMSLRERSNNSFLIIGRINLIKKQKRRNEMSENEWQDKMLIKIYAVLIVIAIEIAFFGGLFYC